MLERLISLVKEQSDIPNSGLINLKTNLLNDLGLSSMDKVNLIVAIESEFDVEIPEQKLSNIVTVADLLEILQEEIDRSR